MSKLRAPLIIGGTLIGFAGLGYLLAAIALDWALNGKRR